MILRRLAPFAILVAIWFALTDLSSIVPPLFLPRPSSVWSFAASNPSQVLIPAVTRSLGRFIAGLTIGLVLGAMFAIAIATSELAARLLGPIIRFFQAVSGIVWIPLAVLWFGISSAAAIFIIFNTTFFIVLDATLTGVRSINANQISSVRTLGGGFTAVLREVLLPGSLPHVLTGLRVTVGYGWRAVIAAEIIASGEGLGVLIWQGQRTLNSSVVVAGLIVIGIISFLMVKLVVDPLERNTVGRWGLIDPAQKIIRG